MPRMNMSNSTVDEYNARIARRTQAINNTPATDKQLAFIEKLETELTEKISKAARDVNVDRIQAQFTAGQFAINVAKSNGGVNKQIASTYISSLIQMNNYPFVTREELHSVFDVLHTSPVQTQAPRQEPAPIGVYKKDNDYYRVANMRNSDRRVAYRWNGRKWDYARGYVFQLTANELLSVDEVRAFGLRTGMCAICGRTLTDPESVQKGIGPICEGKYGRFLASVSA